MKQVVSANSLEPLKPTDKVRIYDLVHAAGINVDDWANYKGGASRASQNPKYCYEWAFVEPGKFVALCLWYDNLELDGSTVYQEPNPRVYAESIANRNPKPGTTIGRARRMDNVVRLAYEERLPVKVIICERNIIDGDNSESKASTVVGRKLDSTPWAVTAYDIVTGECVITRGAVPIEIFDQYSIPNDPARTQKRMIENFVRDRQLRDLALCRACGHCEYCGRAGFETVNGYVYLETHHVIPLSEGGVDSEKNIVALCANDHRAAHYGKDRAEIQKKLTQILSRYYASSNAGGNCD